MAIKCFGIMRKAFDVTNFTKKEPIKILAALLLFSIFIMLLFITPWIPYLILVAFSLIQLLICKKKNKRLSITNKIFIYLTVLIFAFPLMVLTGCSLFGYSLGTGQGANCFDYENGPGLVYMLLWAFIIIPIHGLFCLITCYLNRKKLCKS